MGKKNKNPIPLKDVISGVLESGVLPFNPDDTRIWDVWNGVVGEAIAAHARPLRIKNKRLKVGVSDPIWYQELNYMADEIKDRLNQKLARKAVTGIHFIVGPRPGD